MNYNGLYKKKDPFVQMVQSLENSLADARKANHTLTVQPRKTERGKGNFYRRISVNKCRKIIKFS